jgi:choline dehydrogenase
MDRWAELVQDDTYRFGQVLPFYQRTATFYPPDNALRPANASASYNPDAFSDAGEPLQVSYPIDSIVFSTWMARGMKAIGIQEIQDFNSGTLLGAQWCPFTVRPSDRTRSSSEAAFRERESDDGNDNSLATLTLYELTMGKRVLFDSNKSATGVQVQTGASAYRLHANHEVIVSAGAFQSPQLLMVSGIGPAETLRRHGIPHIVDLPGVGQNMWDHLLFGPSYRVSKPTNTRIPIISPLPLKRPYDTLSSTRVIYEPGGRLPGLGENTRTSKESVLTRDFGKSLVVSSQLARG